jgi:hypothetical protein
VTTALRDGRPVRAGDEAGPLVTLTATDGWGSGVDRIMYRLAGEQRWTTYEGPFRIAGPGARTVEYRASDLNGNVGPVGSVTVAGG